MNNIKSKLSLAILSGDFFLLNVSFFVMNYLKSGNFRLSNDNVNLLLIFYSSWIFVFLFMKKYRLGEYKNYMKGFITITKSSVFIVYSLSFFVVFTGLIQFSRIHILGTCILFFLLEMVSFSIYYEGFSKKIINKFKQVDVESFFAPKLLGIILFIDFSLLTISFFLLKLFKANTSYFSADYEKVLLIMMGLWFFVSVATRKFDINNFVNYFFAVAACVKAVVLMAFIGSAIIYVFRLSYFSRLHIYGALILFLIFEVFFYFFYFKLKFNRNAKVNLESVKKMNKVIKQEELPIKDNKNVVKNHSFMEIMSEKFLSAYPGLLDFVKDYLSIDGLEASDIALANSPGRIHVKVLPKNSISLLMNLHKVNDIRWINQYFLEVHDRLFNGGFLIGRAITIDVHKKKFFEKFPKHYSSFLYFFHFIFFRIFPKLPVLKKIYFAITKGKNRAISRAEVLGRLYFCGFEVLAEEEINGSLFFIAQKTKTPSSDPSPTYGPLVKLKRIGLNGRVIQVFKFRTMYPYSEYLQEYIYKRQKLETGGKIREDFRVTEYGQFMRKYWLDELPMLFNWIRGELKFFGVRPLSMHYLSLYDRSLTRMRQKVKPGLIPPFYSDLPKIIEDITESERRYISEYCKHPLRTQWKYFWKAMSK